MEGGRFLAQEKSWSRG